MRIPSPSPAMVVALVALVLSTTGTTIAATTLLPRDSVGASQLRSGAVGTAEIRNRTITLPDLAYSTIGSLRRPAGVAGGELDGTFPSPGLATGAVTASALADGSVEAAKIADGAVSGSKLADASIGGSKFAEGSIGGSKLADASIGGSKIMSGSIDSSDLVVEEAWRVVGDTGEVPFNAGWGSSPLGLYQQAGFRKDRFGTVHLRGVAWRAADGGASYMFALPAGYRPLKHRQWPVASFGGTVGVLDVEHTGGVWVSTSVNDNQVSLDGISFVADQ